MSNTKQIDNHVVAQMQSTAESLQRLAATYGRTVVVEVLNGHYVIGGRDFGSSVGPVMDWFRNGFQAS